jgi:hypothetical protein
VIVEIDAVIQAEEEERLKNLMTETTAQLLEGNGVLVDTKVLLPGERYHDDRGKDMWKFLKSRLTLTP